MPDLIQQLLLADNMFLAHTLVRVLPAAFLGGAIGLERRGGGGE